MLAAALLIVMAVVMSLARLNAAGRLLPSKLDCDLPCWNGIHPGETSISRAFDMLNAQGYRAFTSTGAQIRFSPPESVAACIVDVHYQQIAVLEIGLSGCPHLRLGDVLLAAGLPLDSTSDLLTIPLQNGSGTLRAQIETPRCGQHFTPFTAVRFISLTDRVAPAPDSPTWRGFASP